MNASAHREPGVCPSQLQLDRLFAGELSDLERARLERHLAACPACERQLAARAEEQERFEPEPRLLAALASRQAGAGAAAARPGTAVSGAARPPRLGRRLTAVLATGMGLAAAAVVLLLLRAARPAPSELDRRGTRKGGFATVVCECDGQRRELGEGSRVRPGDRLQVYVRLPDTRFVAVYSRDGGGAVARYAPVEGEMAELAAGERELPNSTILDEVAGAEQLAVFACERPLGDAQLRAHVVAGSPEGCEVARVRLVKEPR
jgi:hypothetical protein